MADVSFVILNYNGAEETAKLVQSLLGWNREQLDFSIVVVDNCSSDDSFQHLQHEFADHEFISVIKSERNGGYSYGNNFGAKFAIEHDHPKYIAIANPDVELEQEMMIRLLETFKVNERIAMCAPVMKSLDGQYSIHAQKLPTYGDDLRACLIWSKPNSIKYEYETISGCENCILTEMLPGSFFVIRSDVFVQIGLFDENVFLYCEERILGKRLKDAGYLCVLRSDQFYIHAHAVTTSKAINEINRWKILLRSRLYYQGKYNNNNRLAILVLSLAMRLYLLQIKALYHLRRN